MTGAGHLEVRGSLQKNLLTGSGGDDIFDFFLPTHFGASDRVDGGGGNDTLRFSSTNSMAGFNTLTLNNLQLEHVENVDIFDTNGGVIGTTALNIAATAVSTSKLHYFGNDGNNKISTGAAEDTLNGNGGFDTLVAGGGNDVIQVDSGADQVTGLTPATSDSIDGGLGDDELWFVSEVDGDVMTLNAGLKGIEKIRLTNDKGDPETFQHRRRCQPRAGRQHFRQRRREPDHR
jgi:Ca2+-binding RTX toxin-like protein